MEGMSEKGEATLKGTGAGNEFTDQMGNTRVMNFEAINPVADGCENPDGRRRRGMGESSHRKEGG